MGQDRTLNISLSDLRHQIGRVVDMVAYSGKRVTILRHGRAYAALVPLGNLHILEEAEAKSLTYKEFQNARKMQEWAAINVGLKDEAE